MKQTQLKSSAYHCQFLINVFATYRLAHGLKQDLTDGIEVLELVEKGWWPL